ETAAVVALDQKSAVSASSLYVNAVWRQHRPLERKSPGRNEDCVACMGTVDRRLEIGRIAARGIDHGRAGHTGTGDDEGSQEEVQRAVKTVHRLAFVRGMLGMDAMAGRAITSESGIPHTGIIDQVGLIFS